MKRILPLFILLCGGPGTRAADLVISNNAIICWFSDSTSVDDDSALAGNITGYRAEAYLHSYLALNYPDKNISFYNFSRSGGLMNDEINAAAAEGLTVWGYQFNLNQHLGIAHATENGSLNSNQMYLAMSNLFQAPFTMTNGVAMTNEPGWASTNFVQWVGMGALPQENANGDGGTVIARNGGGTNAGWTLGVRGVDIWGQLSHSWTNDFIATGGANVGWFAAPKAGHPGSGGQLSWALAILKGITTDTNLSTCTVDWSAAVIATNHCVLSSSSRSGNTLTFTRHDDRLPMAWDLPDGAITNDCSGAFRLFPGDMDLFRFTLQITNLPAGNYAVKIDGVTVAVLPSAALANGWNMFTNTVGPYWNQRKEVLGRIRDLEYVNRVTLVPGSAGDGVGIVSLDSNAGARWAAGDHGDALINSVAFKVTQVQTNFTAIHDAAQPTNHTFSISLVEPHFVPFHK